ncbi:MAG: hypothetical protein M3458_14350, partial [Acidobacteriota bacterium]|nr:hypothetical protein [Acidobacteriota bacterium]
ETPSVCGLVKDKAERVFQMLAARQARHYFFRFSKILFLEVYRLPNNAMAMQCNCNRRQIVDVYYLPLSS